MGTNGQGSTLDALRPPLLRDIRAQQEQLGAKVQEAIAVVRRPAWGTDLAAQMETVRLLRLGEDGYRPIPVEAWNRLNTEARLAFAKIPHQSALRWDQLLQLPDDEDIARALRYVARDPKRYPSEEAYPLDGWLGTYLRWVQEGEVPMGYHFWSAVVALGATCHRNAFLDRGSFYLYPAHSVLLVGPPAVRKTQAVGTAVGLVERANQQHTVRWQAELRRDPARLYDVDPRVRLLPHDTNFLHIIKALRGQREVWLGEEQITLANYGDSCGMMGLEELGTLLSKDGFAVGKTIDTLIALCDAPKQYRYSTERQGLIHLNNVALSLLAATTPQWLRENLTSRMFLGGFSSRILFIHRLDAGGRYYPTPAPLDPLAREELAAWLCRLSNRPKMAFQLTPEAAARFDTWYGVNHKHVEGVDVDERLSGYFRRKDGHVLRLAMVLAVSMDEAPWISAERFDQAVAILDHEELTMLECFREVGRHPDAPILNLILAALRRAGGELTHSDWLRRCHHYEGVGRRFGEFVDVLVAMNRVQQVVPMVDGRPVRGRLYRLVRDEPAGIPDIPGHPGGLD